MDFRATLFIFGLFLVLTSSGCIHQGNYGISAPSKEGNYTQNAPNGSAGKTLSACDIACIDFCEANPNIPFIAWEDITPLGSTKNCKTILEEELGVPDLSTCEECRCLCSVETT